MRSLATVFALALALSPLAAHAGEPKPAAEKHEANGDGKMEANTHQDDGAAEAKPEAKPEGKGSKKSGKKADKKAETAAETK